jgi:hypothetical protein
MLRIHHLYPIVVPLVQTLIRRISLNKGGNFNKRWGSIRITLIQKEASTITNAQIAISNFRKYVSYKSSNKEWWTWCLSSHSSKCKVSSKVNLAILKQSKVLKTATMEALIHRWISIIRLLITIICRPMVTRLLTTLTILLILLLWATHLWTTTSCQVVSTQAEIPLTKE